MKKNAGAFVLVLYGILAICMIGCGSLEEDAAFVSADPPSGSTILPDDTVTVTFDNTPIDVDVEIQHFNIFLNTSFNAFFEWELDREMLTIRGNPQIPDGTFFVVTITWATGRKILKYDVRLPAKPLPPPGPPEPPPAEFVSLSPSGGKTIAVNASITVTFGSDPGNVTASAGTVAGAGKTRTISGPFTPGALSLTITWTNGGGSLTVSYTVAAP